MQQSASLNENEAVRYEVFGNGSWLYPFVSDIPSFDQAVKIALRYPDVYGDGSATHMVELKTGDSPCYTRRWKVMKNGDAEEIPLKFNLADSRIPETGTGAQAHSPCLTPRERDQLFSLIRIAEQLGLASATLNLEEALIQGAVPIAALS